ncbi:MAG TPA: DUF3710 domain-containing protein [Actinomycetales bacterium]|nr:DUF3710 domain-containing protein [Actinomycetales bacterium]
MGLFSRRRREADPPEEEVEPTTSGPWDVEDKPSLGNRVDLGALRIPKRPGMTLRLELERASRIPVAATVTIRDSALQLQAYAAPRTMSLWEEVRPELAASVKDAAGQVEEVSGEFGTELVARMPVTTPGGTGTRTVRFVGVDGPRWMVRATFSGKAATDTEEAAELESVLRGLVVLRGTQARPPREVLPLTVPGQQAPAAAEEKDGIDSLGVLRRGPEMTETR